MNPFGTSSRKVKQRALFVLAQSKSPRAREVLRNYAKGSSTPELQSQAIQYLGVHGGPESRTVLAEVYSTTTDVDVKRRILRAFMVAGEKDRLLTAAQSEKNPELRAVIRADTTEQHGRVIRALDLLKQAGVSKIAFGVTPVPPEGGAAPSITSSPAAPIPINK